MTNVFHRQLNKDYPVAVRGDGIYIYDKDGKQYIDGSGGAAVSCLGYNNSYIQNAMKAQIDQLSYVHNGFFTTDILEKLANKLVESTKRHGQKGLEKTYIVSGGSEAIESAIKMVRQYFLEIGKPDKHIIISRKQSYHGNTLGALSHGGNLFRRKQFEPILLDIPLIEPCYSYRLQQDDESEEQYSRRAALGLEEKILEIGSDKVAAFMAETVVGATGGVIPPTPLYLKYIREICDRYGILLILDEVMCGMGRTGTLHAYEQEAVMPDMLVIAKGLAAGYQPIGALIVSHDICEAFQKGSGAFQHGHTFMGHAVACAAAYAAQQYIEDHDLLKNIQDNGLYLRSTLTTELENHPNVGDVRGRGFFVGLELVVDKETKEPFPNAPAMARDVSKMAMKNGLMCYPGTGTTDHFLLAPHYISTRENIDEIIDKLTKTLNEMDFFLNSKVA